MVTLKAISVSYSIGNSFESFSFKINNSLEIVLSYDVARFYISTGINYSFISLLLVL